MAADFTINQGDAQPIFAQQLLDSTNSPVDLTGATATLQLRSLTSTSPLTVTGSVSIFDPANGKLQWQPTTQDTSTPGDYMGKWVVIYANGQQQTYPTDGWLWVRVEPNLTSDPEALVSLPDVKDYLASVGGPSGHQHDDKLLQLIYNTTPLIENIAGPIIPRVFEEWHDGGQYAIVLRRKPSYAIGNQPIYQLLGCDEYRGPIKYSLNIISEPTQATIYSCMLDPPTGTVYRRTTGGGVIPFGAAAWSSGMPQAVHVIYQAGQTTIPGNIRLATLETIRWNYMSTQPTGMGDRTLADTDEYGTTPMPITIPRSARELLAPNRRRPAIA